MVSWELIDVASIPGNDRELRLYQRHDEFSIRIAGRGDLMNSRLHGSEDALAELACARLVDQSQPRILIGGLGMGFTLAAALKSVGPAAQVVVAELVPEVVKWNQGPLGVHAGYPLGDARTMVHIDDVGRILKKERRAFDAILLDVDNGPEGLTRKENDWLYSLLGLATAFDALRSLGILAVWSAGPDRSFPQRLRQAGFEVETITVRAHRPGKGERHTIWLARRSA
jgi:spermidine synthase